MTHGATADPRAAVATVGSDLLPPDVHLLVGTTDRVWVVGPGALARAPWGVLPLGTGLLGERPVVWTPHLHRLWVPRQAAEERVPLVAGAPTVPDTIGWRVPAVDDGDLDLVGEALGVEPFTASGATADEVAARAPGASVVWLSARCVPETDARRGGAAVALSGSDEASVLWTAEEVRGKHLAREPVVVLSGCHAAADAAADAALFDLGTAFLDAGASTVVMARAPAPAASWTALATHLASGSDRTAEAVVEAFGPTAAVTVLGR